MAHPHIFMTKEKEPRFFDTDTYYNRGLDRYLRDHFRGAAGFKARGEATPCIYDRERRGTAFGATWVRTYDSL